MEKKLYSSPLTEVENVSTELMHLNSPSQTEFPGGPADPAPSPSRDKYWI